MSVNYSEISALYHHGIKGMHWGVRKEDDEETRLAFDKNRLAYEKSKLASETKKDILREENATTLSLGKQKFNEAFEHEKTLRQQSKNEAEAKRKKYVTIGAVAVIAALAASRISRNRNETKLEVAKINKQTAIRTTRITGRDNVKVTKIGNKIPKTLNVTQVNKTPKTVNVTQVIKTPKTQNIQKDFLGNPYKSSKLPLMKTAKRLFK